MSKTKSLFMCAAMLVVVSALARGANTPTLSSMSPTSVVAGSASFTLTVKGSNFVSGSVVLWNNSSLTTTYVSGTQLTATVPGTTVSVAGTRQVAVYNPGRFGGTSNALTFTITPPTAPTGSSSTTSALTITTTSVPNGTTGTAYSAALAASGGTTPYTWTVSSGALPAGIALSASGAISGTPTTGGSFSFTAHVADSAAHTASYTYALSITSSPLAISTASLANGTAGTAYSATLAATGGTSPYTWTITSGGLPAGLSLASSGAISGTPTTAATYSFSVQVTDSSSGTSTKTLSMTVAAPAPPPPTTACSSPYGNCSDPYEGGTFTTTGKLPISACGTAMSGSKSYYLTQNIGTDPTVKCLDIATGDTLDLRGFTVTGQINLLYNTNSSGITIFNGNVACNIPDTTSIGGCIRLLGDRTLTAQSRIHHLTVDNVGNSGSAGVRTIELDSSGSLGAGYKVDHVTLTVEPAPSSVRTMGINVITQDSLEINNCNITCSASANACQGIQVINGGPNSVPALLHDNLVALLSTAPGSTTWTAARGIAFVGPDTGSLGPSGFQVYNNFCTANTNRCFRARQITGATFQNNTVYACADADEGCYHLADPSSGGTITNYNILVTNESIQMQGGTAFFIRNGQGITVKNIGISGTTGKLGRLDAPSAPANVTFCGIAGASTLGTSSVVNVGATVNILNGGNWAGTLTGTGTINALATCP